MAAGEMHMEGRIKIDLDRKIGKINPNIFGQFMCRRRGATDGAVHCPGHALADEHGCRKDVFGAVEALAPAVIRWPGGNTGTSYHWQDGVGPIEKRPRKMDLHFGVSSNYHFGTDEFISFCKRLKAEPFFVATTGTGTLDEAAAWLEYCNLDTDTYYADMRRANGHEKPYPVHYWQIGNETYGLWEIGHTTARAYGAQAREWGKTLRRLDPSIEVVAVGDYDSTMWYREVLEEAAEQIDYLTFHSYWDFQPDEVAESYYRVVADPLRDEMRIKDIAGVIEAFDHEHDLKRKVKLAFTEFNAWCLDPKGSFWEYGKPQYSLKDALAMASCLNVMQRNCNWVTLATAAQTTNVAGLLLVTEEGMIREPVYWPLVMSRQNIGPVALDVWSKSATYAQKFREGQVFGNKNQMLKLEAVPYLDVSASLDAEARKLYVSVVNRHRDEAMKLAISVDGGDLATCGKAVQLYHENPIQQNTFDNLDAVMPKTLVVDDVSRQFSYIVPAHSFTILVLDLL